MKQEMHSYGVEQLFDNLQPFLSNKSSFVKEKPGFSAQQFYSALQEFSILVVGAGGLGCQLVKNLVLSGIRNIYLIDMDTIDLTNLNRQFLFRKQNIGQYKADCVADFIMRKYPGVKITTSKCKVQQMPRQFYQQFTIIIAGLDNVEARKWLNNIVHEINLYQQKSQTIYIDGSTEKLGGQCLVVEPFVTACYNCSRKGLLENKAKANYCTIASTPRTPQHCIQYVIEIKWKDQFPQRKLDADDLEDMKWVYQQSLQHAKKFKIQGVTEMLTLGVTKNIIPAVASTNALIAAVCTNQAIKIITGINPRLNNYFVFFGGTMIGGYTVPLQRQEDCPVTNMRANLLPNFEISLPKTSTLGFLVSKINQKYPSIQKPFITFLGKTVANPGDLERYPTKLQIALSQYQQKLNSDSLTFSITDKSIKSQLKVIVYIE